MGSPVFAKWGEMWRFFITREKLVCRLDAIYYIPTRKTHQGDLKRGSSLGEESGLHVGQGYHNPNREVKGTGLAMQGKRFSIYYC
jgi:hypothetical protein